MSRMKRPLRPAAPIDRPSRLLIFVRRQRRLVRPALVAAVLLGLAGAGLHVGRAMRSEAAFAPIRTQIAHAAGLRVTAVTIEGRNMTPESQVLEALGVGRGDPLLGFSVEAARRRIDRLAFVEHCTVERRLPGTVLVQITERRPFAVWQNQGRFVLIDRDGQVVVTPGLAGPHLGASNLGASNLGGQGPNGRNTDIAGMSRKDAEAFAELPLVVGAGAPGRASALIDALAAEPVVRGQVAAGVRIGQRRWNLTLRSGADVLLPEGAEPQALHRLAQLERDMHLLERPLAYIDMRLPDRLVVRPRPPAPPLASPAASPAGGPISGPGDDPAAVPSEMSHRPVAMRRPA